MPNVEPILEPAAAPRAAATPRWVDVLYIGLVAYCLTGTVWMLAGFGGPQVTHYVALLSDAPATLVCAIILGATARRTARGAPRIAWTLLAVALALYFVGVMIGVSSWLQGLDPFPGPADIFYCVFYPALMVAALLLIRAAQVRVPWIQLSLDATIFVVGFGAFFWFLVIAPAAAHVQLEFLKEALSLAYLGARLRAAADVRRAAAHRRRQCRRAARSAAAAGGLCGHVPRRHPLVARQGARLLPAGPVPGCAVPVLLRAAVRGRARADAQPGPGAHRLARLGCARALAALRRDAGGLAGAGVLQPRRHRRPGDADDRDRVRAHAAAHGAPGGGAALGCAGARAARGAAGRGALRLADRQRFRRHHDRGRAGAGALRLARRRAHPRTEARADHRQEPAASCGRAKTARSCADSSARSRRATPAPSVRWSCASSGRRSAA